MIKILPRLTLGRDGREEDQHGTKYFPCSIYETTLQRKTNRIIPQHWHNEIEIGFVDKGEVAFYYENEKHVLYDNEVYFIGSSCRHSMVGQSDSSVFYSIVFHEDMIAGPESINEKYLYPVIHNGEIPFLVIQDAYILNVLKQIVSLGEEQAPGYELLIRNHLSSSILWIYRKYRMIENVPEPSEASTRVERMLDYIADHYMYDIQVKEIADCVHISVRECYRAFRTELGSSPTEYLRQYRLKKAADLLVSTNLKIEDIAGKCGYNRSGYFATRFKDLYGCSPTAYRKLNRQNKL